MQPLSEEILDKIGTLYHELGEETIIRLVDRFYEHMDTDPEVRTIRAMHPSNLDKARKKLQMYLIGRFGGPPVYVREYGHPRLKARHHFFPIGTAERDQWMKCMKQAVEEVIADEEVRKMLLAFFHHLATFMINQDEERTQRTEKGASRGISGKSS